MATCETEKTENIMEQQEKEAQEFVNQVYNFAANLMFEQEKSATETKPKARLGTRICFMALCGA